MRSLLFVLQVLAFTSSSAPHRQAIDFSRLVARLSEGGGFFDSDNLVSNETSYLHVIPAFKSTGVAGGAYIGVGPEQSFSYIAEIRPALALQIDIRRDNMLLHLLFKAMFASAANRMEYLCQLYGRPVPPDPGRWSGRTLEEILLYFDITPPDSSVHARNHAALMERVTAYGVPLDDLDRQTLARFHGEFAATGLNLRYTSLGRPSRPGYPSERDLYLATDLSGRAVSYLSSEERWTVVRTLQRQHKVVPVVGDLSGQVAMKAIADYLREIGLTVSALYASNVEMYLFRNGTFPRFVENVRALPTGPSSVIIRSGFGRGWRIDVGATPMPLPGHLSAQVMQRIPTFLQLTANPDAIAYWQLLTEGVIDLQVPPR